MKNIDFKKLKRKDRSYYQILGINLTISCIYRLTFIDILNQHNIDFNQYHVRVIELYNRRLVMKKGNSIVLTEKGKEIVNEIKKNCYD